MELSYKELAHELPMMLKAGVVPYIRGSPALGKSSLARMIAEKFNLFLIDIRLSERDPCEIGGYLYLDPVTKRTYQYPLELFPLDTDPIPEGYKGWLILLDEFSSCAPATQAVTYRVIWDRQVGQRSLHKKAFILAAGNLETDNAIVEPLSTALLSRFAIYTMKLSHPDWMEWAATEGIDYRITSFLNFKQDYLYTFTPDATDPYGSPRTWEMLSDFIKGRPAKELRIESLASLIGEGVAREFMTYLELQDSLPTFESILKNPTGIDIKPDLSIRWALMGMIAHRIDTSTVVPCTQFLDRFPDELRVVAIREIRLRHPKLLAESKEFSSWFNKVAMQTFS